MMPTDIETQLRDLGERFRSEVSHVHPDEILSSPRATSPIERGRLIEPANRPSATRRPSRWLTAIAAVSVLVLVGGLIVISQRNGADVGVSDRPASCAHADDPVSFDAQTFPAFDSDPAETGYPSAEAAADAYLADRTSAAATHGFPIGVSYEIVDESRVVGPNTIVRANLHTDTAKGTVDIATRAVETTSAGTRWVVEAAASDVSSFSIAEFADGSVTIDVDPRTTGSNYATANDPSSGVVIDAGGTQTADGLVSGSVPPVLLDLVAGISNPNVRYWFVNANTIEFTEVQLNQGYPDLGEGWQSLQRLQLC